MKRSYIKRKPRPEIPLEVREAVWYRDKGKCVDCGGFGDWRKWLDMAHYKHRGMGGSRLRDTVENLRLLCPYCHDVVDGRDRERRHDEL